MKSSSGTESVFDAAALDVVYGVYFRLVGICILKRLICFYFGCLFPLVTEIIQPPASQRIGPLT